MNVIKGYKRPVLEPCELDFFEYKIDPYIGCEHYCYYCYALNITETDWAEEIHIRDDIAGQLKEELSGIAPQPVFLSYHTDPYQPCEEEYQQTRRILEVLQERNFTAGILTKSGLVARDIDLLQKMDKASVNFSIAFTDDTMRQKFEARTSSIQSRLDALKKLHDAGIGSAAMICPIIPYLTDVMTIIDWVAPYAQVIWMYGLSIEEQSQLCWRNTREILKRDFPDLVDKIEEVVLSKEHPFWTKLRQDLETLKKEKQLNLIIAL